MKKTAISVLFGLCSSSCLTLNLGQVPYMDATGRGSEESLTSGKKQTEICYVFEPSPIAKLIAAADREQSKDVVAVRNYTIYAEARGMQNCLVLHGVAVMKDGKTEGAK